MSAVNRRLTTLVLAGVLPCLPAVDVRPAESHSSPAATEAHPTSVPEFWLRPAPHHRDQETRSEGPFRIDRTGFDSRGLAVISLNMPTSGGTRVEEIHLSASLAAGLAETTEYHGVFMVKRPWFTEWLLELRDRHGLRLFLVEAQTPVVFKHTLIGGSLRFAAGPPVGTRDGDCGPHETFTVLVSLRGVMAAHLTPGGTASIPISGRRHRVLLADAYRGVPGDVGCDDTPRDQIRLAIIPDQ